MERLSAPAAPIAADETRSTQPDQVRMPWHGETGRISIEMLSKWIPDLRIPIYYVAGPSGMVAGVRQILINSGISEDDIRAEEFVGYE
jgi:ferredoxin-NADP reductase